MSQQTRHKRIDAYNLIISAAILVGFAIVVRLLELYQIMPINRQFSDQEVQAIFLSVWIMCLMHNWLYIFTMTREQMKFEVFNSCDKVLLIVLISFIALQNHLNPNIDLLRSQKEALEVIVWFIIAMLVGRIIPEALHFKEVNRKQQGV